MDYSDFIPNQSSDRPEMMVREDTSNDSHRVCLDLFKDSKHSVHSEESTRSSVHNALKKSTTDL